MAPFVDPHPCIGCGEETTNPKFCGLPCFRKNIRHRTVVPRRPGASLEERFWRFIPNRPEDDCWMWIGAANPDGRAVIWSGPPKRRHFYAHHVAYKVYTGKDLEPGQIIRRWCGNQKCMNPKHFTIGTRREVLSPIFRANKMNARWGNSNSSTKIPDEALPLLRQAYREGRDDIIRAIAEKFGATLEHARRLSKSRTRRRLKPKERLAA